MNSSFLGVGTNVGDRHENIRACLGFVRQFASIVSVSNTLETPALLPPNAPPSWNIPFINLAIHIQTNLSVFQLLPSIKLIEKTMGRNENAERWSPRIIDVDILTFNNLVFTNNELTIPHEHITQRHFVLEPLCEIAPNIVHPIYKKTFKTLFSELSRQG